MRTVFGTAQLSLTQWSLALVPPWRCSSSGSSASWSARRGTEPVPEAVPAEAPAA